MARARGVHSARVGPSHPVAVYARGQTFGGKPGRGTGMPERNTRRGDTPPRMRGIRRAAAAALVLPAVVGGFMLQSAVSGNGRLFEEVLTRVASYGVDAVPQDSLYALAARGLIRRIGDPYAELYSPEQLADFQRESLRNGYGGLGMLVELVRDTATVMKVYPGTPAAGTGVRVGDRIVEVDGQKVTGLPLDRVTAKLLGPQGTTIHAVLVRHGEPAPVRIEAHRVEDILNAVRLAEDFRLKLVLEGVTAVSYTHLTLPTICSV